MNKNQIQEYLKRINFSKEIIDCNLETLFEIHSSHVYHIPFENLDIWNKKKIELSEKNLFKKIIKNNRGGFCYELNYLFWMLLDNLGFNAKIISARIFDDDGKLGPEFDHMAILVLIGDERWLADVGFGDLFIKPISIDTTTIQNDVNGFFKIRSLKDDGFLLLKENNNKVFEKKYKFNTIQRNIEQFKPQCEFKQYSKDSYFVKNKICTLPTGKGRTTVFNNRLIRKVNALKEEYEIHTESKLNQILQEEFQINMLKHKN
ncbi:MAG: arylamine N-acetyltransferase [Flavobacteriaceae bacterium]|nr:arylamine N-acetyltransferase [Flavobacteriaceae bacterium]